MLTNSEVSILLSKYLNEKQQSRPDYVMPKVVKMTKDYVDKMSKGANEQSLVAIRRQALTHPLGEPTTLASQRPPPPQDPARQPDA